MRNSQISKAYHKDFYLKSAAKFLGQNAFGDTEIFGSMALQRYIAGPYKAWEEIICQNQNGRKRLMDFGCGQGRFSIFPAKNGFSVTGVDFSETSIKVCKKRAAFHCVSQDTNFAVMDVCQLACPDSTFDIVIESGVFPCINLYMGIAEIRRILKNSGIFIMVDTLAGNPFLQLWRKLFKKIHHRNELYTQNLFKHSDLDVVKKFFNIERTMYFGLFTPFLIIFKKLTFYTEMCVVAEQVDQFLFSKFTFLKKFAWKIVIQASIK